MMQLHYNVAGHSFSIKAPNTEYISYLLSSYRLFMTDRDAGKKVFVMEVTPQEIPVYGAEINRFMWDFAEYIIYYGEDGYTFRIIPEGSEQPYSMRTSPDFTRASVCLKNESPVNRFILNNFVMMMYAFSTVAYATLMVHASVVMNAGKGYLFLGKSGTGKSTHSMLWMKNIEGSDLLNDDNPIVRVIDGEVTVYGSPWSGKTPCYRNIHVPVGGIVRLHQAPYNKIEKNGLTKAFADLLSSCSAMKWDNRVYDSTCDTVSAVVQSVPCFKLGCLPDADAARLCHSTLMFGDE